MPRQPKWVAAGIYQPAYQPRHAYGPRRQGRHELVEDYIKQYGPIEASAIARYGSAVCPSGSLVGVQLVSAPMPRGGFRWLIICPRCQKPATRLYERWHPGFRTWIAACRMCWGLRYQSQYAGRRLEAHPEYLQAVVRRQLDREPRSKGYNPFAAPRRLAQGRSHRRRMVRYQTAAAVYTIRRRRHMMRAELATDLAFRILLVKSEAQQRRRWRKILNQVLWHGHTDTMRELIALRDTPEWAREVLQSALQRAENDAKTVKLAPEEGVS